MAARVIEIPTDGGPARLHVVTPPLGTPSHGTLLAGHGAGGGIGAVDLQALARALPIDGWTVVLIEQPWRVAGRRVAGPPPTLDAAFTQIVRALDAGAADHADSTAAAVGRPFVFCGRSAGARVACRTASPLHAAGVLALSFPLVPPSHPDRPRPSRLPELALVQAANLPLLVIQGRTDPYGDPAALAALGIPVVGVTGSHTFAGASVPAIVRAARDFLGTIAGRGLA